MRIRWRKEKGGKHKEKWKSSEAMKRSQALCKKMAGGYQPEVRGAVEFEMIWEDKAKR